MGSILVITTPCLFSNICAYASTNKSSYSFEYSTQRTIAMWYHGDLDSILNIRKEITKRM